MGMYTALSLGVRLADLPEDVIEVLDFMTGKGKYDRMHDWPNIVETPAIPDHPFFECERWRWLLTMDSYYFDYQTHWEFEWDRISGGHFLTGVSNIKNYGGEIAQFLDWLNPYIDTRGFIGWTQYEEAVYPTLIIKRGIRDEREVMDEPRLQYLDIGNLLGTLHMADEIIEEITPHLPHHMTDLGKLNDYFNSFVAYKELY